MFNGVDHHLGRHGTQASRLEYARAVARVTGPCGRTKPAFPRDLIVAEPVAAFGRDAIKHDRKDGRLTGEMVNFGQAERPLDLPDGKELLGSFGQRERDTMQALVERFSSRNRRQNANLAELNCVPSVPGFSP